MISLNHIGLMCVIGNNSKSFLQGQITCDINEINQHQYRFAAFCNAKGRVIATTKLFLLGEKYYLQLPQKNISSLLNHLERYAALSKIELSDVSNQFFQAGILNKEKKEEIFGLPLPEKNYKCNQADQTIILRLPNSPDRFELISANYKLNNAVKENADQWKLLDIVYNIPTIYPETSGLFTPHMLRYDTLNAINLSKGCYIGQEIINRTANFGNVKKYLVSFQVDSDQPFAQGEKIYNEEQLEIGIVLGSVIDKGNCFVAAVMQNTFIKERLPLIINHLTIQPTQIDNRFLL